MSTHAKVDEDERHGHIEDEDDLGRRISLCLFGPFCWVFDRRGLKLVEVSRRIRGMVGTSARRIIKSSIPKGVLARRRDQNLRATAMKVMARKVALAAATMGRLSSLMCCSS